MAKKEAGRVRGFYRVTITENGDLVGDSGWNENVIVNNGFNDFLCKTLGALAGSAQVTHMALGTGSAPGAADTTLEGEVSKRAAITAATSATSKTVRFTATFDSTNSFVTATKNISNIGLFNSSATGTMFSGNTFASSSCATNQNVNCTYDIAFT